MPRNARSRPEADGRSAAVCYGPIRQAQEELCRELSYVHLYYQQAYNEVGAEAAQNAVHALGFLAARPK